MRRIVTTAVALALMGGAALSAPAVAADQTGGNARPSGPGSLSVPSPAEALELAPEPALPEFGTATPSEMLVTARRVLTGKALPRDPSATLALRDLWLNKTKLRGSERRLADRLLARPTDGVGDPRASATPSRRPRRSATRACASTTSPPAPTLLRRPTGRPPTWPSWTRCGARRSTASATARR